MEKFFKALVFVIVSFLLVGSVMFYFNTELYDNLVKEDGFVEYMTAFNLLICSILLFVRFVKVVRYRKGAWIAFNLVLVLGLFFGFGEEVSWGQRIFSIESSNFFMENNVQKETNLHNLEVNGVKINKLVFSYLFTLIFGTYFLVSLITYKKVKWFRSIVDKFGVPIPQLKQTVVLIIATIIILLPSHLRKWEIWEALFAILLFWIFVDPFNSKEKLIGGSKFNS